MDIASTAGSLGMSLLKNAIDANHGSVGKAAEKLGGKLLDKAEVVGEKLIDKLGDKFADILDRIGDHDGPDSSDHKPELAGVPAFLRGDFGGYGPSPQLSTDKAVELFQRFDTDGNGQVSKIELQEGLQKLKSDYGDVSQKDLKSPEMRLKLSAMRDAYRLGEAALRQYDGMAALDGNNAGIASTDWQALAKLDGDGSTLNRRDWFMAFNEEILNGKPYQPTSISV